MAFRIAQTQHAPASHAGQPCNPFLSRAIDLVLIEIDSHPRGLRRRLLRCVKYLLELGIPAYPQRGC